MPLILLHYFKLIISLAVASHREKNLMGAYWRFVRLARAESNSGGAIIPNVEPFHPLGVVAAVNFGS